MKKLFENHFIKNGLLVDHNQNKLMEKIENLREQLILNKIPKSLYIYGGVGSGKTMLMDIFHQSIISKSLRIHWTELSNILLKEYHLISTRNRSNSSNNQYHFDISNKIIKKHGNIICIDEIQIPDIGFYSLLSPILQEFLKQGCFIMATSNRHPIMLVDKINDNDDLARTFIDNFEIYELNSLCDYRSTISDLSNDKIFLPIFPKECSNSNCSEIIHNFIENHKEIFNFNIMEQRVQLEIHKRFIDLIKLSDGVAKLDFNNIIINNFGANDFLSIGSKFHTVFLYNLRQFNMVDSINNDARRFMNFIDVMYNLKRRVFIGAECPLGDLFLENADAKIDTNSYGIGNEVYSSNRVKSRLNEMSTLKYLRNFNHSVET